MSEIQFTWHICQ